jgi:predicted membrane-bound spermidine synthase
VAFVELLGFQGTLVVGLLANWCAAAVAFRRSLSRLEAVPPAEGTLALPALSAFARKAAPVSSTLAMGILFTTGLASMGMEVVWTRAFAPILLTQVYSFAGLLFMYLLATWCGSMLYRRHLTRRGPASNQTLLALLGLAAGAQLLAADPRIIWPYYGVQVAWVLFSIAPYCAILGYLTPRLIDEYAQGRPDSVGHAYAVNAIGCIVGPLLVSYLLLPNFGLERSAIALAVPLWLLSGWSQFGSPRLSDVAPDNRRHWSPWVHAALTLCGVVMASAATSYEDRYAAGGARIYHDSTATVIAGEIDGIKTLLVNGKPITAVTPSTKLMAHLPLALLPHRPKSALVICFGMGATYRSLLSWDVETTAVELVPSVSDAFGAFFADAQDVRRNPRGRIIIDDGRRYLRRTNERYDVITLDPPPPVEAAGSSLLYSREFYQLIKPRLAEGGILQQWYPGGELQTFQAILRSVVDEFPHVRVTRAFDGWGYHILCSLHPIAKRNGSELIARLPDAARRDLVEWSPDRTAESLLEAAIAVPVDVNGALDDSPSVIITDDRPFNEYYLLRRLWEWWTGTYTIVL